MNVAYTHLFASAGAFGWTAGDLPVCRLPVPLPLLDLTVIQEFLPGGHHQHPFGARAYHPPPPPL